MKFVFLCLSFLFMGYMGISQRLVVGTYTDNQLSKGIYVYDFDIHTGKATEKSVIVANNPSYLAIDKNQQFIYSVNESDKGKISSFLYNKDKGSLSLINSEWNHGSAPCYISIDQTGKWLFSGNYSDGSLAVHPIKTDGSIGTIHQYIKHHGGSIKATRQSAPHVHCTYISGDNKSLYVPDLGLDKVVIYPFDATSGLLDTAQKSYIQIKPGGGPRHIIFSKNGNFGYLIEEMSGSVNVIKNEGKKHTIIQTENYLPKGQEGAGADIHLSPDGKFLYTSQRSNSTLQLFKVNDKTGRITFVKQQSSGGNFPRNFTIHPSGKFLLAANQQSNDIAIFSRNITTGLLTDTGQRIKVGSPVCLLWISGNR